MASIPLAWELRSLIKGSVGRYLGFHCWFSCFIDKVVTAPDVETAIGPFFVSLIVALSSYIRACLLFGAIVVRVHLNVRCLLFGGSSLEALFQSGFIIFNSMHTCISLTR